MVFCGFIASAANIEYSGAAIYYSSSVGSSDPDWNREIVDQRNEDNISAFTHTTDADIEIDVAHVTNQGTHSIDVAATQFVWRSSVTNISHTTDSNAVATGSGEAVLQITGSNAIPMNYYIQGMIASTASNLGTLEYSIELHHLEGTYAKQVIGPVTSNFVEYGTLPAGIFIFEIVQQIATEQHAPGTSSVVEESEFIFTLFDQEIADFIIGESNIIFQISGHPSASYGIQATTNLVDGAWISETNQVESEVGNITIPISNDAQQMYYRSKIQ